MKIAGRETELKVFQNLLQNDNSDFLAVYGRRRIGKTFLIREFFKSSIFFEASGLHEKNMRMQLEAFSLSLKALSPQKNIHKPKTWIEAFSLLQNQIEISRRKDKKVIFLDEIAWFETPKSGFLSALDYFWNQFCNKRTDILLIICGSAASWIINKVINNTGGLHNRITCQVQLQPFTLHETKQFLNLNKVNLTDVDIVKLYMSVGGVAFYLKDIKPGLSVAQLIDNLYFNQQALLKNEFNNLYAALFKNSEIHVNIIKALASKNKGLTRNELLQITKMTSGGGFSNALEELQLCGFIKVNYPIDKKKEDLLYRLVDEYSIFYLKFIANEKQNTNWLQVSNSQKYKIWTGYAFENLCFKHVEIIKKQLGINGIISTEYSWVYKGNNENKGTQIDFIIDRNDNCINIFEIKFQDAPFEITKTYAEELNHKINLFKTQTKTKKNVFITLLSSSGSIKNEYYLNTITNEIKLLDIIES